MRGHHVIHPGNVKIYEKKKKKKTNNNRKRKSWKYWQVFYAMGHALLVVLLRKIWLQKQKTMHTFLDFV